MKKKILFISSRFFSENSGSSIASKRNYDNLVTVFGEENVSNYKFDQQIKKNYFIKFVNEIIFKRAELITIKDEKMIINLLKKEKFDIIFFDSSSFGFLCKKIQFLFPEIKKVIFFHDIQIQQINSLKNLIIAKTILEKLKKIKFFLIMKNYIFNEKLSCKYGNLFITLNKRDQKILKKEYNKNSEIISMSVKDLSNNSEIKLIKKGVEKKFLFVGKDYGPNIEGLIFFIKKVLPYINIRLDIVGNGMEKYKKEFESFSDKVRVIGKVNSLEEYYNEADAVIAPIFSGGGMKVKTAEALMHGKTIFGTTEAFEGYEVDFEKIGGLCNTSEEFIEKINEKLNKISRFNIDSREIFLEKYSYQSTEKIFKKILYNKL